MVQALHFENKQDHIMRLIADGLMEQLRILFDISTRHILSALTRKKVGQIFKKPKKEKYRIVRTPGKTYRVWGE